MKRKQLIYLTIRHKPIVCRHLFGCESCPLGSPRLWWWRPHLKFKISAWGAGGGGVKCPWSSRCTLMSFACNPHCHTSLTVLSPSTEHARPPASQNDHCQGKEFISAKPLLISCYRATITTRISPPEGRPYFISDVQLGTLQRTLLLGIAVCESVH